jgi:hypothetical protein
MGTPSITPHLETARDALTRTWIDMTMFHCACTQVVIIAAMNFWMPLFDSRGSRAIETIDESPFGGHLVIHAKFRKE